MLKRDIQRREDELVIPIETTPLPRVQNNKKLRRFKFILVRYRLQISIFLTVIIIMFLFFSLSKKVDSVNTHVHENQRVLFNVPIHDKAPLITINDYKMNFDQDTDVINKPRRARVREAMAHAFNNYAKYAWGHDELKPLSKTPHDWVTGGTGLTIIDGIDTLYIMGLEEEYAASLRYVQQEMPKASEVDTYISVFEITIRVLGGLLSAYDLTNEKVFLTRATELGDRLLPAFNRPSGIPHLNVNLHSGDTRSRVTCTPLSEIGSLTVEFSHLSDVTGDSKYEEAITKVTQYIRELPAKGLYPVQVNPNDKTFCDDRITLGALGDSFYEYLHKMWLLHGSKAEMYRAMFEESVKAIMDNILIQSEKGWWYISEMRGGQIQKKIDHLVCFAAGMFALSYATNATPDLDPYIYNTLKAAKEFAGTCVQSYRMTNTGLAPEIFLVNNEGDVVIDPNAKHYLLRPETVESLFLLYRVTGDEMYRNWGWEIFTAIENHCRLSNGYSGVKDVNTVPVVHDNLQQSFFLAETLKYLYLLFSPSNVIPLNEWVLNTEAHPLKIKR
jgi:mannosyl-oligosaccharide alpha-1,2-mannosidase